MLSLSLSWKPRGQRKWARRGWWWRRREVNGSLRPSKVRLDPTPARRSRRCRTYADRHHRGNQRPERDPPEPHRRGCRAGVRPHRGHQRVAFALRGGASSSSTCAASPPGKQASAKLTKHLHGELLRDRQQCAVRQGNCTARRRSTSAAASTGIPAGGGIGTLTIVDHEGSAGCPFLLGLHQRHERVHRLAHRAEPLALLRQRLHEELLATAAPARSSAPSAAAREHLGSTFEPLAGEGEVPCQHAENDHADGPRRSGGRGPAALAPAPGSRNAATPPAACPGIARRWSGRPP
jgi:hypothetical protein